MYYRHMTPVFLSIALSMPCLSFAYGPRFFPRRFAPRKGLSIPSEPPTNTFREELEASLANKSSLIARYASFHNPIALRAIRQTEWLRHLQTTQNISPGFLDTWSYGFAESGVGPMSNQLYPITQEDAPQLYAKVAEYSHQLNLEMPMILLLNNEKVFNAFATCMRRRSGFIIIGRGLLNATSTDECSGIIAHELGHLHHRHIPKMLYFMTGAIGGGCIAFSIISYLAARIYGVRSTKYFAYALPSAALYALTIPIIESWLSRRFERQADAIAARINLANGHAAMKAIESFETKVYEDELTEAQDLIRHRYKALNEEVAQDYLSFLEKCKEGADTAREPSGLSKLYATHPPTSERLAYFEEKLVSEGIAD